MLKEKTGFFGKIFGIDLENLLISRIKFKKKQLFLLILVLAVGFFLRTYHFSDWLRFNADQSRDAAIAIDSAEKGSFPLLGPKAGGTDFKLGPVFYYFQIMAVKFFGSEPAIAAYPDLFFSLMAIGAFFYLMKVLFEVRTALFLTSIYSVSYYVVKYSRFAWNPNSTAFFVMLFLIAFYLMLTCHDRKRFWWTVMAGISLGISVQLHTSLLVIMPLTAIFGLSVAFLKKKIDKPMIAIVLGVAFMLNIPQFISEFQTKASNTRQLFTGTVEKSQRNASFFENLSNSVTCHIRTNGHILTSVGSEEDCGISHVIQRMKKLDSKKVLLSEKIFFVMSSLLAIILSAGGYWIAVKRMRNEKDENKKIFFQVLCFYVLLTFLIFTVWATELSMRFFLAVSFVPFVLLGFWSGLSKSHRWKIFVLSVFAILVFLNLHKNFQIAKELTFGGVEINGNFDYMTLKEGYFIRDFILEKKQSAGLGKDIIIDAQAGYLFKMLRPLQFLLRENGVVLVELRRDVELKTGDRIFYIRSAENGCNVQEKISKKYETLDCGQFRQFSVLFLNVK